MDFRPVEHAAGFVGPCLGTPRQLHDDFGQKFYACLVSFLAILLVTITIFYHGVSVLTLFSVFKK
jgi:hypothetical protein